MYYLQATKRIMAHHNNNSTNNTINKYINRQ